jgi:predicted acyltransferase
MTPVANRLLSLDVFRGLTIVLMILVNSQNSSGYPLLLHADWNGFTLADLVFPSFLFIVGLTSVVSLSRQIEKSQKTSLYSDIIKRSIILFLLGLFLNIFPWHIHFSTLRFYGILQRIAVCYLVCSFIYLNTTVKTQIMLFVILLIGYWFVMTQISVPGFGVNQLTPTGSWVSYFDQLLFSSAHLYETTYDPEGFFSTIPSIATTLFGVLIGQLILNNRYNKQKKFYLMAVIGLVSLVSAWLWSSYFPINKNLWTSSFALWASGISLIVFTFCFLLIDILAYQKWSLPFKIFGMNALFAFIVHVLLLKIQVITKIQSQNGTDMNLKQFITDALFPHCSAENAALFYALAFILFNYLIVWFLYKRKIFIRI